MPWAKSPGVEGAFAVVTAPFSSMTTQSVNVPPISTPTRYSGIRSPAEPGFNSA